jgi:hypothetical protein
MGVSGVAAMYKGTFDFAPGCVEFGLNPAT